MSRVGWAVSLVLAAQTAGAAELRELLAVLEIAVEDAAVPEGAAALLTDQLRSASRKVAGERLKIMTRENMTELLPPGTNQRCFVGACLAQIGVMLQARYVMGGTVRKVGSRLTLTVEAYDSNSKNLLGSEVLLQKNVDDMVDAILKEAPGYVRAWIPGLAGATVAVAPPAAEPSVSAPAPPAVAVGGPTIRRSSATTAASDLTITAKPADGVRLDITEPSGRTFASGVPYKNPQAQPGPWKVTARAAGYEDETREVDVPADDMVLAKLELKLLGELTVTGTPAGAQVTVTGAGLPGGRDEGGLPWEASGLASGAYRVKVARTGYRDYDEAVQVQPGRAAEVKVALRKVEVGRESATIVAGRYEVGADTVRDTTTGLTWRRYVPGQAYDWEEAKSHCGGLSLAGGGWRLPTNDELESLVDKSAGVPTINHEAFPGTPAWVFWSSTPNGSSDTWGVGFGDGRAGVIGGVGHGYGGVRCVR